MRKKLFLLSLATIGAVTVGVTVANFADSNDFAHFSSHHHSAPVGGYTLSFSPENLPAGIPTSYQNTYSGSIKTDLGNDINMSFVNIKLTQAGVQVANHGRVYNYGSGNTKITGINGISFTGAGSFIFRPAISDGSGKGYVVKENAVVVNANAEKVTVPECDYFELEAGDSGATLTSLNIAYSCDDKALPSIKLLDGTYTGVGSDSYIYKLVVNNGAASIETLNRETKIQLNGTAVMLDKDTARCTFVYNTYNIYYTMDFNGHSFTFVSKTDDVEGEAAALVAQVSFDRVYNVEDFQSYSATGQGYTSSTTKYQTTGLRANYYADFYTGSSSGEIGGNGWPIMTSTDNSNLLNTKGHNGTKGGAFKFHPSGSDKYNMRYIFMNELYGIKSVIGKGATLSFWARTPYTNQNYNTDYDADMNMKFYAYYDSPLTPSTQTTVRETFNFTIEKGGTWQHFEMPLTASRNYYGFGFYAEKQGSGNHYVPLDDIEVYTASPYATYVAPAIPVTGVEVTPSSTSVEVNKIVALTAEVAPANADNKAVTWSSANTSIATVSTEGIVRGVSVGTTTITATTVDNGYTDTCEVEVVPAVGEPNGVYVGTATALGNNVPMTIVVGSNGPVSVNLSGTDAGATGLTYDKNTKAVTITTTGSYLNQSFGTVTAVYDEENDRLTNIGCDGDIASYVSNNGQITANKNVPLASLDCDGTTSELQAIFKRRTGSTVSTDADRIVSDTTNYASGAGALKLKGNSSGDVRLNLLNDLASPISVNKVGFWVYNPTSTAVKLRFFVYQSTGLTNHKEFTPDAGVAINSNGWTYFSYELESAYSAYNFQIADFNSTGVSLTFDEIAFYNTLS